MVGVDGNAPRTRLPTSQSNGFTVRRRGQHPYSYHIETHSATVLTCDYPTLADLTPFSGLLILSLPRMRGE
jgi:hypothetical protein